MLRALEDGYDLVVASRYVRGGGVVGWPLIRRLVSRVATLLAHLTVPRSRAVKDPMSGYFALKREVLESVRVYSPIGYKLLLTILAKGRYSKIKEVPMVFRRRLRGESKLDQREVLTYLKLLLNLLRQR
jgi:dolichol-phosphate mannosyltransferase